MTHHAYAPVSSAPHGAGPDDVSREGSSAPLLSVQHLTKTYQSGARSVSAVDDVTFDVYRGQTLGIVGESGSGKSTVARMVLGMTAPTNGTVSLDGRDLASLSRRERRAHRRRVQMVFQDPFSSLNPRWTLQAIVSEPLRIAGTMPRSAIRARTDELLDLVGLKPGRFGSRTARQLSGGQAQRVGIARALALSPQLLVCDAMVSALDVSVQAQILNLFKDLQQELDLTTLSISHDLAVVRHMSDRVAVMYLGQLVELADAETLFEHPKHPYTEVLLDAVLEPVPSPRRSALRATTVRPDVPSSAATSRGCRFRLSCPRAEQICADQMPSLAPIAPEHRVACHFPSDDDLR